MSGCSLVGLAAVAELLASISESVLDFYEREPVSVEDFYPEGQYRGERLSKMISFKNTNIKSGVCKLLMKFQNQDPKLDWCGGSGWLIDTDTVVTAEHNLYNFRTKSHAVEVVVLIGFTGGP